MLKSVRGRIIFIAVILGICGYYIYANGLKLGLDLQGGMHLVVEIDDPDGTLTDEARADAIDRAETVLRTRIDELGVEEPLIQKVGDDRIIVELAGISDENQAKEVIRRAAFLEFKLVRSWVDFAPDLPRIDRVIVATLGADSRNCSSAPAHRKREIPRQPKKAGPRPRWARRRTPRSSRPPWTRLPKPRRRRTIPQCSARSPRS